MYLCTKLTTSWPYTGVRYGGKNEIHLDDFVNFHNVTDEIASDEEHKLIVVITESIAR